jgi:SpoVK/Ycf46/Vps4 family AAA+-type ATPase
MTTQTTVPNPIFDKRVALPDDNIARMAATLFGFETRYNRVQKLLKLLIHRDKLEEWSRKHHQKSTQIINFVSEQHPLVILHGDVGTGKSVTAEGIAHRIVQDGNAGDSELFKLSTRVRGSGRVGEMGTLLNQAFSDVVRAAGKNNRAFLIIDEGDSLAAKRSQEHSHHEDKVAVNTLIQNIDELRNFRGRIIVFLCTNRLSAVDPALVRRAAIIETFERPTNEERLGLFRQDLDDLEISDHDLEQIVVATGPTATKIGWTYSDIRSRLYPAVLAKVFPNEKLKAKHFLETINEMKPSPAVEDM